MPSPAAASRCRDHTDPGLPRGRRTLRVSIVLCGAGRNLTLSGISV